MTASCRSSDQESIESELVGPQTNNVYHTPNPPTTKAQFPYYHPVKASSAPHTVHCRSLMSAGNGFPPFDVVDVQSPASHIERGVGIGDVGYIDSDGAFFYCFNIFYPSDHPIQEDTLPREFVPLEPPLADWEVRTSQDDLPPGCVIASEGVSFTSVSQNPLKISFSTSAREGAVLVLPRGASREDLVDTGKLYPYLKQHASDWYQFINHYSDIPPTAPTVNGSLFVVTGSDKAKVWARAMFPQLDESAGQKTEFTYDGSQEDSSVWVDNLNYNFKGTHSSILGAKNNPCSLFLRGITLALGDASWTRAITPLREDSIPLFALTTRPITGNLSILDELRDRYKDYPVMTREVIFHPAIVILQMMLSAIPSTEIALFEDSIWSNLVAGRTPSLESVVKTCRSLLNEYDVVQTDDVVHLRRKDSLGPSTTAGGIIQQQIDSLKDMVARWRQRRRALAKLKELLPRPTWSFVHSHANFQNEYLRRQDAGDD